MCRISEVKKEVSTDVEIGYSVHECEILLRDQDNMELKCSVSKSNGLEKVLHLLNEVGLCKKPHKTNVLSAL